MCGRFYVDDDTAREIEKTIRQVDEKISREKRTGDIHPTEAAMVILKEQREVVLKNMKWGFPKMNDSGVIINARAESALEKKLFRDSMLKRRLIIPASGFYEWNKNKEKATFSARVPVLYMAGFYGRFEGEDRFVILTTAANQSMKDTHDRMPLILEEEEIEEWLKDDIRMEKLLHKEPRQLRKRMDYEQQNLFL